MSSDEPKQPKDLHGWQYTGLKRPPFAETPASDQESVWDYPRPPRVEPVHQRVRVEFGGITLADSERAYRVVETASPPVYYIPADDVRMEYLTRGRFSSVCEWKGRAGYWSVQVGTRSAENAAWSYSQPLPDFEAIRDHIAFYARKMDACFVGEQRVAPQPGGFYGGWVTPDLAGPIKGEPGTEWW